MSRPQRQNIGRKLRFAMIVTGGLSVILVVGAFVLYEVITFRDILVQDLVAKAEISGQNCTAALLFANKDDAEEILSFLSSQPRVTRAAIYDTLGVLFTSFIRSGLEGGIPLRSESDGFVFEANSLELFHPIILNGKRLGTIFLQTDLEAMNQRFVSYGTIAILVLVGSFLAAFGFATVLERKITRPLLDLTEIARTVSERQDFSVRAIKRSEDELGVLADAFNHMLVQIHDRDEYLVKANEAMALEIEERKRIEKDIRAGEERFRQLFESHPLPMWVYDKESLQFLEVNESALKTYGYSRVEYLSMRITEIRPPEDIQFLKDNLAKPRDALQFSGPWRHRLKDGAIIDVEIISHETLFKGRPAVLVVVLDVTERIKAERELHKSEERYRSVVLASSSIIWTADFEGRFVVPQKSWERYTGQRWEEHAGFGWSQAIHEDDREKLLADWHKARESSSICQSEGRMWHMSTNCYRYFTMSAVPLLNPDQSVREWIGTVTDVHAERAAQEEIKLLNVQLEDRVRTRTSQLEAANKELEAFSYSVSHDLRSPLRHVDGFSELLRKRVALLGDEKILSYAQTIADAAKRMGRLIDELLVFSRMGRTELKTETVSMTEIVQDVLREMGPEIEKRNIEWLVHELPPVSGDKEMLRLVLQNLISNAVKYSGKREMTRIEIGAAVNGGFAEFFVKDNGAGFDMKYVGKLFGVFQRLHRSDEFEGIGIGLANVRRIVHRHGGETRAVGELDNGATFYFTLPYSKQGEGS